MKNLQLTFRFDDLADDYEEAYEELWFRVLPLKLKPWEGADVTILNRKGQLRYLHNVPVEKKWRTEACTGMECPYCRIGNKRRKRLLYSVVDHREVRFRDKYGRESVEKDALRYLDLSSAEAKRLRELPTSVGERNLRSVVVRVSKPGYDTFTPLEFRLQKRDSRIHHVPAEAAELDFDHVFDREWRRKQPLGRRLKEKR